MGNLNNVNSILRYNAVSCARSEDASETLHFWRNPYKDMEKQEKQRAEQRKEEAKYRELFFATLPPEVNVGPRW